MKTYLVLLLTIIALACGPSDKQIREQKEQKEKQRVQAIDNIKSNWKSDLLKFHDDKYVNDWERVGNIEVYYFDISEDANGFIVDIDIYVTPVGHKTERNFVGEMRYSLSGHFQKMLDYEYN